MAAAIPPVAAAAPPRDWGNKFNETFVARPPTPAELRIRYERGQRVEVMDTNNAWLSQGDNGKREIRMPAWGGTPAVEGRGRGRPPTDTSPHARFSRAVTITKHLYEQVPGATIIYLKGTSFNTPNATCVQNAQTAMQCFEGAVCDLDAKFPQAITGIVSKLELKHLPDPDATPARRRSSDNEDRTQRVDAHGLLVVDGEADVGKIVKYYKRYLVARGSMSLLMHNKDTTQLTEINDPTEGPQSVFIAVQYITKAHGSKQDRIDRDRTRDTLQQAGIPVIGHYDDLLVHLHLRTPTEDEDEDSD